MVITAPVSLLEIQATLQVRCFNQSTKQQRIIQDAAPLSVCKRGSQCTTVPLTCFQRIQRCIEKCCLCGLSLIGSNAFFGFRSAACRLMEQQL